MKKAFVIIGVGLLVAAWTHGRTGPPPAGNNMITEASDNMITEGGDQMVVE